jgi:P-type E1-E2 ATPase
MKCRSSTLNVELREVKYIFFDKTGTLTVNKQNFISASIGEIIQQSIPENNSVDSIKHSISSFVNSILYIFSSSFFKLFKYFFDHF